MIAVIGTSPAMALIALRAAKKGIATTVFEGNSEVGGAWQLATGLGTGVSQFNNNIFPSNTNEQRSLKGIAQYLRQTGIASDVLDGAPVLPNGFAPDSELVVDLGQMFRLLQTQDLVSFKREFVSKIYMGRSFSTIGETRFDHVYIPRNTTPIEFTTDRASLLMYPRVSVSRHIHVHFDTGDFHPLALDFSENFDNVFDRGQFRCNSDTWLFVGRVRREFKHLPDQSLIDQSQELAVQRHHILRIDNHYYSDNQYSEIDHNRLALLLHGRPVTQVNTYSFITGISDAVRIDMSDFTSYKRHG